MLLIPVARRILLVILFLEIRLLLRSLKPWVHPRCSITLITDTRRSAQWLSRIILWVLSSKEDLQVPQNDTALILETLTQIYSASQQWSRVPQKVKFSLILTYSC
jgi:hypothetical protein